MLLKSQYHCIHSIIIVNNQFRSEFDQNELETINKYYPKFYYKTDKVSLSFQIPNRNALTPPNRTVDPFILKDSDTSTYQNSTKPQQLNACLNTSFTSTKSALTLDSQHAQKHQASILRLHVLSLICTTSE